MSERPERPISREDPIADRTPQPFGSGPADPAVFDGSVRAMRQRSVNFAAKRYVDLLYVSGLDRATADRHFRWRAAAMPGGLSGRGAGGDQATLLEAHRRGQLDIEADNGDYRVTVAWNDPDFGPPVIGSAIARHNYGGILLGPHAVPGFDPKPIARRMAGEGHPWPMGEAVEPPHHPPVKLVAALRTLFANSPGIYGILIASPHRVLVERYNTWSGADRATPSWSMTKAITCTVIGRLIHEGWLRSVHDPAPAPLWGDPRAIQHRITLDHLLRMRSGLAFPVLGEDGAVRLGFENSAVYLDAADAFETAQRSIVATEPGAVFRYVNSGINVLGAVLRAEIERRGLPYHATLYGLLADRLGMRSYQHSADLAGNLIASGAGFATLRDYAKLGVLYLQDGVWGGERLLPAGWAEYALTPTHTGTSYAACFRTNADLLFPMLSADTAWASGASDQRIFIVRRHRLVVAVANETDHPMDLPALGRLVAAAIGSV